MVVQTSKNKKHTESLHIYLNQAKIPIGIITNYQFKKQQINLQYTL